MSEHASTMEHTRINHRIVEQATDLIYLLEPDLRLVWLNRHSVNVFTLLLTTEWAGRMPLDGSDETRQRFFVGKHLDQLFHPDDAAFLQRKIKKVMASNASVSYEHTVTTEDRRFHFSTKLIPVHEEPHGPPQILGITRDITEKRELDERIYNAEKLASIGILAAGVAHEINNPLAIILGFTELLLERFAPESPEHRDLKLIEYNANHAKKVVEQMLGFARVTEGMADRVDIHESVDTVTNVVHHTLTTKKVALKLDLAPELPAVKGDPREFQQVLFNLINNAVAAMAPQGGQLTISTRSTGNWVDIQVSDTGVGIPDRIKNQVFDPFFTTKKVGEGTGLGLSLCYGIVSKLGGMMRFSSESAEDGGQNTGTTFTVSLPALVAKG